MHFRKMLLSVSALAACLALIGTYVLSFGQETRPATTQPAHPQVITGPYVHENLAVYLVHGKDQLKGREFLTLQEALVQQKARILETGDVNKLMVENLSKDEESFLKQNLTSLRLTFVEDRKGEPSAPPAEKEGEDGDGGKAKSAKVAKAKDKAARVVEEDEEGRAKVVDKRSSTADSSD